MSYLLQAAAALYFQTRQWNTLPLFMTMLCNLWPPGELEGPDATLPSVCRELALWGRAELYSDTKMLGALKVHQGEKHTLGSTSAWEPRQRLMQSTATCSFFFFFFKWIQEVNSSCSHSQKEAKRAESSGWDPWLAKADLANLHWMLNSEFSIQSSPAPLQFCPTSPAPFQQQQNRAPLKMCGFSETIKILNVRCPNLAWFLLSP